MQVVMNKCFLLNPEKKNWRRSNLSVTSFFGIKVCIFCVFLENDKTDLRQIFFRILGALVYYKLH